MRPRAPSPRALYRRWYTAAGPWAGFFRAVPLVAWAQGIAAPATGGPDAPDDGWIAPTASALRGAGRAEGWLARADVLLILDLPGVESVITAWALAPDGVRPVLLLLRWPEPGALLDADALLAALVRAVPRRALPAAAQYALVLERERDGPRALADLATHFDNRYELGTIDLPSAAQLQARQVVGVVACRLACPPPAPDLDRYLDELERAGLPVRRLVLDGAEG